ncbi:MAG: TolC family protein [Magnetococcales bacterium]|nr:TolC family protein [Magnetococcales bacterium]MBF0148568.1 TolC family protein [Magnetococcales bacterium]MBF0173793.1 TolC family protein [Magnetococcales bacterium]MBF0348858.1 TolC family protein [Magnetococcales bacterium]MBF0629739.1 TolC family protein [Magnetococcales bacterium]
MRSRFAEGFWGRMGSALGGAGMMLFPLNAGAETLQEAVETVLQQHDRIHAARSDLDAAGARKDQVLRATFTPTVTMTSHVGHERQSSQTSGPDTDMTSRELDLAVKQLLFDFGKGLADVEVQDKQRQQMQAALENVNQTLILDAVTSFLNLNRATKVLDFAKKSVANIRHQGEVESARVTLGKGYSTDVLQAKAQLAGAEARQVQSRGILLRSEDHARTVFLREPREVVGLVPPDESLVVLPKTMDEALQSAIATNPQLHQLAALVDGLDAAHRSARIGGFLPTVNGVWEYKMKNDVSGVDGFERENFVKAELAFPFNMGLASVSSVRAAERDLAAARNRYNDTLLLVQEQVRTSWHNLETSRENAELLTTQATLAEKFLEQAKEERAMDKRTLLDVLNGETALINAQSDALSAATDVRIASYSVLQAMGTLTTEVLRPGVAGKLSTASSGKPGNVPETKKKNQKAL